MSYQALDTQGTTISYMDTTASPPAYADIGEVKTIAGPSGRAAIIDTSDLNSTYREKRIGLPDYGEITLTVHLRPNYKEHYALQTKYGTRTRVQFQLTFVDSTTWTFYAYVGSFAANFTIDAVVEGTITLVIDGAVVTSASS